MRKRSRVIPLHLTDRELRQLNEKAERSGLSREELLRSLIRGAELRARPCEHHADQNGEYRSSDYRDRLTEQP